ncbi:MAG: P-loop NTPase [Coriobacteriales bacterium]|jgi:MinD-like ATPase involved in chromosome partitioning or flagellar assembly|nr:P-loop NTPase [Coriobacteriales bacterium]
MNHCGVPEKTDDLIGGSPHIVALAFAFDEGDDAIDHEIHDVCKCAYFQIFKTALHCRRALAVAASHVQVLITENDFEVSALNLAAALHKDNHSRDIYLQNSAPSGLFLSRSEAAGVRGVIDESQARGLLRLSTTTDTDVLDGALSSTHTMDPAKELAWLEDYLALDELDEGVSDNFVTQPLGDGQAKTASLDENAQEQGQFATREATGSLSPPTALLTQVPSSPPVISTITTAHDVYVPDPDATPSLQGCCQVNTSPLAGNVCLPDPGCPPAIISAFVSGRGGVGKSSLSVLTAVSLHQQGARVVLADMDLQFGDLAYLLGTEESCRVVRMNIAAVLSGQAQIPELTNNLLLLEPPSRPELAESIVASIPQLFEALRQVADVVILNTSCLWDELSALLVQQCDQLLFAMDQRATSVEGCRQAVELCVRLHVPSTKFLYVLNRCSKNAPITDLDASLALGGVTVACVVDGGRQVDEMLALGLPAELLNNSSQLTQSVESLGVLLSGANRAMPASRLHDTFKSRAFTKRGRQERGVRAKWNAGGVR